MTGSGADHLEPREYRLGLRCTQLGPRGDHLELPEDTEPAQATRPELGVGG